VCSAYYVSVQCVVHGVPFFRIISFPGCNYTVFAVFCEAYKYIFVQYAQLRRENVRPVLLVVGGARGSSDVIL
jgi:hypothetical protein